jgi:hypothetical protein
MHPTVPPPLPSHAQHGSVAATVRSLPAGARPAEVWRRAAHVLLRLNVKECEALGLVFEDAEVTDTIRVLVLDLLAGAGSAEAQAVMRRLLALGVARRNARIFATFVQRLGFVEQPDGKTLRFLTNVYAESKNGVHDVLAACAYALGASAGQAFQSGEADIAARACDVLRRDLRAAGDPREKAALLAALGNGGVPSDARVILRFALDADPLVRSATALALRKISTSETRAQLVAMLADPELRVAECALAALNDHRIVDDELERLAELVLGGRTALALDGRILRLVVSQRPNGAQVAARTSALENALRLLLGRAEALDAKLGSGEHPRLVANAPSATGPAPAFPEATRAPSWTGEQRAVAGSGTHPVVRGEQREDVRSQLEQLGLDPNAAQAPPPPRREAMFTTTVSTDAEIAAALSAARSRPKRAPSPSPYAILRGKAVGGQKA